MPRSRASAVVRTIGLVAILGLAGGVVGGLLVAALVSGIVLVNGGSRDFSIGSLGFIALVSSGFGAAYGVVLGPLLGWVFMRRVPIGRAIGETALLAACGVELAMVGALPAPFGIFGLPVLLASMGALRLRYVYREKTARAIGAASAS